MKRFFGVFIFIAAIAAIDHGLYKVRSQAGDPMTLTIWPPDGTVLSHITNLHVTATSMAAPITHIIFYRDGVPFKTNYYSPPQPERLQVKK